MHAKKAIVIGAGIVGLALARSLARKGFAITVFERHEKAVGASIRNFGMIWPIGQPGGVLYERAINTKAIWKEVCADAGLWYEEAGSLHLVYNSLGEEVLQEFADANRQLRPVQLLTAAEAQRRSKAANPTGLRAALWSADELIIESRVAMEKLPAYLCEKYNVQFHFNTVISAIQHPRVFSGSRHWSADLIFVCGGADFETLYPETFTAAPFTKCKLQMMRLAAQPNDWRIGPALCGGLSLLHYKSFAQAPTLPQLQEYYQSTLPHYLQWGIHVMLAQNAAGELTVGDSHEYGLTHDPFDKQYINRLILDYLKKFARLKNHRLIQTWNGIYPKLTNGGSEWVQQAAAGVVIVNGLGGAGMTLSFGLAEEVVAQLVGAAPANLFTQPQPYHNIPATLHR